MKRIYLSPSNQEHNVGRGKYGTEEKRMHELAALVAKKLKRYGNAFKTKTSRPEWSMAQVVADSNAFKPHGMVCLHTNAGGGDGTVGFYGSAAGKALLACLYRHIAPLSPGKDEGMRSWPGLYEIRYTTAPVAYLELFFHDNAAEVTDYLATIDEYAEAIVHGICDWAGVAYEAAPAVDYRPLKREAKALADALGIPNDDVNLANSFGKPARELLRSLADHQG